MATNVSASVPSLSETDLQLDRQQGGGSMGGAGVDADVNDAPLPGQQEGIITDVSEIRKVEGSRRDSHLRAIVELEELGAQYTADEIIIPSNLREILPSAVETLLSRLESLSSDDPVRELSSKELQVLGLGNLFGGEKDKEFVEKFGQMREGWSTAVRLRIMRAAGNCNTLEIIHLTDLNLSFEELNALMDPLQTSLVLRTLKLYENAIVDTYEGCKIIVEFLKVNRSLRVLHIVGSGERPHSILHYMASDGHPTVENLYLGWKLKKEEIARIIQACPNLQEMPNTWTIDNEETATMYAKALIEHPSFCHVRVNGPAGPVSSFLLSSCTGARSVTSLISVSVRVTGGDERLRRNVLEQMFLANRKLEDIFFDNVLTFSEEWQGMFCSLKQNNVVRSVRLLAIRLDEDEGFNLPAWEELVAWVKQGSTLQVLTIYSWGPVGVGQHDLCSLFEAITSNNSGIQSLTLGRFLLRSNEMEALISMIKANGPLTSLELKDFLCPRWDSVFNALRYNSVLTTFTLISFNSLTCLDLEALLRTLQLNTTLKEINLRDLEWSITALQDLMEYAMREEERQGVVTYAFLSMWTKDIVKVIRSFQQNINLQHLHVSFFSSSFLPRLYESEGVVDKGTWDELETLFRQSCALLSMTIDGVPRFQPNLRNLFKSITFSDTIHSLKVINVPIDAEDSAALARLFRKSTSLQQLTLIGVAEPHWSEALASLIRDSKSLQRLTVSWATEVHWEIVFKSLRYNTGLQTLELDSIDSLDDGAFKELLAALKVNSSLEDIHLTKTNWGREGKEAIIRNALEQKARRETYMAVMRMHLKQEFHDPSTGRLFLCGSALAGKTRLRMALTQAARRHFYPFGCIPIRYDLRRTEGIEIQQLNIDSLEISVWDLGGQTIFRTLQDILFPKLNLACVFLLVFSPFNRTTNSLKHALSEELHREILPWLRFIASNSQKDGLILPQVKIVVSHRDQLDPSNSLMWAEHVIDSLRLQFAGILSIDEKIFCINSLDSGKYVHELLNHTVNSFHDLLRNKLFKVPSTCLTLGRILAKLGHSSQSTTNLYTSHSTFPNSCLSLGHALARGRKVSKSRATGEPILSTSEFFDLCQREMVSLKRFNFRDTEGRKLLNAVAEYLHDGGFIIQLVKSDIVVVDPNWFTFSFLGRLIGAGHDFQTPLARVDPYKKKKDGHISTAAFKDLLRQFSLILSEEGYSGVDEERLEKLMREMDLCFPLPQASGYFAPAIFAEEDLKRSSEGLRQLRGWRRVAQGPNVVFVGTRLQCQDRLKTNLTPSFFPRFQVHFRNLLISSTDPRQGLIDCDYNMIFFIFGEYEVYVESDGDAGDHIDIMVRSPTTRTKTVKFIHEKIVTAMQDFCASCCPGVILVVGVLRTKCVEKLTLSAHRHENQAILVEDLKERWKEYILRMNVKSMTWEEEEEEFAKYFYLWPSNDNQDDDLIEKLERAKDLLTDEDYLEVLNLVKGAEASMEKQWGRLKAVEEEIEKEIGGRSSDDGSNSGERSFASEQSRSKQSGESPFSSHDSRPSGSRGISEQRKFERAFSGEMTEHEKTRYVIRTGQESLGQRIDEVNEHMKEVKKRIRGIERSVQSFQHYQDKVLETKVSMNAKLDQLIGITASLAKSAVPNRPYFTSADVTCSHRISAAVDIGKPMILHFMCEERSGSHLVKDQGGYPITVKKENMEFLRHLSVNSVKVLWYLLKAGVHVAAGLGNVIPDLEMGGKIALLTSSAIGNVFSQELSNVTLSKVVESGQSNVDKDSWQFLKQLFSKSLEGQCVEYFLLYRARYKSAPMESSEVWLCRECVDKHRASLDFL